MRHRKPSRPESMKRRAQKGTCRWCDTACNPGLIWHPACVEEFKLIHWPAHTRLATWNRDKGICARCGMDSCASARAAYQDHRAGGREYMDDKWIDARLSISSGKMWQHDHIKPLIEANGDVSFWKMENIQTLCSKCHVEKTKSDNARRKLK